VNEIDAGLADLLHRERQVHPINLGAVEEAACVLRQAEDGRTAFRVVAADAFEETRSVVDRVRENVNLRVGEIHQLPVHPDFFHFLEWHRNLPRAGTGVARMSQRMDFGRSIGVALLQCQMRELCR